MLVRITTDDQEYEVVVDDALVLAEHGDPNIKDVHELDIITLGAVIANSEKIDEVLVGPDFNNNYTFEILS